jgi:hypothetical protein
VDVPPGVWITVGNVSREWKQGAIMSFDDSYHHSVDASQAVSGLLLASATPRLPLPSGYSSARCAPRGPPECAACQLCAGGHARGL